MQIRGFLWLCAYTGVALLEPPSFSLLQEYWKRERERKVGEREKLAAAAQEIKAVPFTDTEVFPLFDLSQDRHGALYNIYIPGSLFN